MPYPHLVIQVAKYLNMTPVQLEDEPYWMARGLELSEAEVWAHNRYAESMKRRNR